jgi:hypothetical protein
MFEIGQAQIDRKVSIEARKLQGLEIAALFNIEKLDVLT